jgi:hypothetical protein
MISFVLILMLQHSSPTLLRMTFDGPDREVAQGAVERHDLLHREVEPRIFLISVEEGDAAGWEKKLNAVLPHGSGRFHGAPANPEDVEKVRRGEIKLQR